MQTLGQLCLIALAQPTALDLFAVRRAVQTLTPRSVMTIERRQVPPSESAMMAEFDGQRIAVHSAPGRIPDAVYFDAVSGNLLWPEAADRMARHRACVTLCGAEPARSPGAARSQAAALTRLAGALAEAMPALGVHWLGTRAMASPERLSQAVGELARYQWPMDLWLGHETVAPGVQGGPAGTVRTVGAAAYLGFEVELAPIAASDLIEPIRLLFGAVGTMMARADVIRDGAVVEVKDARIPRLSLHLGRGDPPGVARLVPQV